MIPKARTTNKQMRKVGRKVFQFRKTGFAFNAKSRLDHPLLRITDLFY